MRLRQAKQGWRSHVVDAVMHQLRLQPRVFALVVLTVPVAPRLPSHTGVCQPPHWPFWSVSKAAGRIRQMRSVRRSAMTGPKATLQRDLYVLITQMSHGDSDHRGTSDQQQRHCPDTVGTIAMPAIQHRQQGQGYRNVAQVE